MINININSIRSLNFRLFLMIFFLSICSYNVISPLWFWHFFFKDIAFYYTCINRVFVRLICMFVSLFYIIYVWDPRLHSFDRRIPIIATLTYCNCLDCLQNCIVNILMVLAFDFVNVYEFPLFEFAIGISVIYYTFSILAIVGKQRYIFSTYRSDKK